MAAKLLAEMPECIKKFMLFDFAGVKLRFPQYMNRSTYLHMKLNTAVLISIIYIWLIANPTNYP